MTLQIAEFCSIHDFSEGETIFRKGDPGNSLYIVKSGEISVIQQAESGQEQEIARYSSGDFFGEVDMLMNTDRNAEARAAGFSQLLRFPGENRTLNDLFSAYPAAGAELLRIFIQKTSARIRESNALIRENSPWVQEIRSQVYKDKLTGLNNKTFLEEELPSLLKDPGKPVSLLMIKPDNFKEINDSYGHDAGDRALVAMGAALSRHVPKNVVVIRFMGNELACPFPNTNRTQALCIAKDIKNLFNNMDLSEIATDKPFNLKISIGIAVFPDHASSADDLIARAHELPLIGRARGSNIILFPEDK